MNSKLFSERVGIPISTIRYYEKIGLLPAPVRGSNNYRHYEERHLVLVTFIKNLSLSSFSLKDIGRFLDDFKTQGNLTDYAKEQLSQRLDQLEQEIHQLTQLRQILLDLTKPDRSLEDLLDHIMEQL